MFQTLKSQILKWKRKQITASVLALSNIPVNNNKYFNDHNSDTKETKGCVCQEMCNLDGKFLPLSPIFYLTVDFKKTESDFFQDRSTFVEIEYIKRKTRLSE